jgi:DNA-binding LacI/PurR family transcriptional regulator
LAGVSVTVASRVINDAPYVSKAKRDAVEAAVRKLRYVPNRTARALAKQQTGAVVLAIAGEDPALFADPYFAQVIVGVSGALEETSLHVMLSLASSGRGQARFENLLRTRGVDGIMLMALEGDDPLPRIVVESGIPTVYGGRPPSGRPRWFVDADNLGGARAATEYLVGVGRRRIVSIAGPRGTDVGSARERGFRDALAAAGLVAEGVEVGDFSEAGGAAAMARLLESAPGLDAVFAASDNMAAGAVRALQESGRAVPGDVAVVGFDDLAVASRTVPALTTIRQPIEAMGREMARMLVAVLSGQDPTSLILPTTLIIRDSA